MKILEINSNHYILLSNNNEVIHTSTTERECVEYMFQFTN